MEKRDFLKGAAKLAALAPLSAGAGAPDNRVFGVPASVMPVDPVLQNKLRLSFARASIPVEAWDGMASLVTAIHLLQTSKDARANFSKSPSAYFESHGVKSGTIDLRNSREVAMANLMLDPVAIAASQSGDYVTFMQKVVDYKLPVLPDATKLTTRLTELLRQNERLYASVKDSIDRAGAGSPETVNLLAKASVSTAPADDDVSVFTDSVAVVSTLAIAYTEVAAVLVAVSAAYVAVVAIGLCNKPYRCPRPDSGLADLDPEMLDGAATATTAARLLGNQSFEIQTAKDVIAREVEAVFNACEVVGLIAIPTSKRSAALTASIETAQRSIGLIS